MTFPSELITSVTAHVNVKMTEMPNKIKDLSIQIFSFQTQMLFYINILTLPFNIFYLFFLNPVYGHGCKKCYICT